MERHHHAKKKEVGAAKEAKRLGGAMEEKKSQAGDPNEIGDGIEHHDLLLDKWQRPQFDVFMHGFDVAEVFEGREVMRVLPNRVWQTDEERHGRGDPKPLGSEEFALRREEQSGDKSAQKKDCGVLIQQAKTQQHTAPEQ